MNDIQAKALVVFLNAGITVLSARIALFLSMILAFALFSWAMYQPDNLRVISATVFSVLVFLPIVKLEREQSRSRSVVQGE